MQLLGRKTCPCQKKVVPLHAFSRRVYAGGCNEDNTNNNSARQHRERQGEEKREVDRGKRGEQSIKRKKTNTFKLT